MTIKITAGKVISVLAIAAVGYITYKAIEKANEQDREFKKLKDEEIAELSKDFSINEASISNEDFEAEDRAKARFVLEDAWNAIILAKNSSELYAAIDKFVKMHDDLTEGTKDEKLSCLIVYHDNLTKKAEKAKRNEEALREKTRQDNYRKTELEKARTIARSIDQVGRLAKNLSNPNKTTSIEDVVKTVESITFTLDGGNK